MTTKPSKPSFSATSVAALPAGEYTDPAVRGLQMRVLRGSNGKTSRTWMFRYKWRGAPRRIVIGHLETMGLAKARAEALKLRGAMDDGVDPKTAKPRRRPAQAARTVSASAADEHSVDHLISEFMERHIRPRRKRPEYAERLLRKDVLPEWTGRDARSVKPFEVVQLLDKILARGSPVVANRVAALLEQLFKFGIHRQIVTDTPVKLLFRPGGKEKARERVLTDTELSVFLSDPKACTRYERLSAVILVLLLTGQRRGELAAAQWSEIDLKARSWRIPAANSKTGEPAIVPLSPWAAEEFAALKREAESSKFVLPAKDPGKAIDAKLLTRGLAKCQERMKALKIEAFTLHDLRRTCRTGLARLKVPPHIAERVLNHAQEKIAGTYDLHEYLDEKRDALNKWARHLRGLKL